MKFKSMYLTNFCSYENLEYIFSKTGLVLISGANGSGKSTFCDALPWILYGKTSKDVNSSDVVSWGSKTPTIGLVELFVHGQPVHIHRARGSKGKDNDLFLTIGDDKPIRGKDLLDTQKLIDRTLGVDYQGFILSHYIHEFSVANNFFATTAKNRKDTIDQLIDFSKIDKLKMSLEADKKTLKVNLAKVERELANSALKLGYLQDNYLSTATDSRKWDSSNQLRVDSCHRLTARLQDKQEELKSYPSKLDVKSAIKESQSTRCKECNGPVNHPELQIQQEILQSITNLETEIQSIKDKLTLEQRDVNPYAHQLISLAKQQDTISIEITSNTSKFEKLSLQTTDQELLSDIIKNHRAQITTTTVLMLEDKANKLLSQYFDAELSISLTVDTADDKIETMIYKSGNTCNYSQLSKGQRQILKFCFSLSIMKHIGSTQGINPTILMFDEIFDGLSEEMKGKAFRLLQVLEAEYDTIFVVEHSVDLKAQFETTYTVTVVEGKSVLNAA